MRNDTAYYELKELELKKLIKEGKPSKEHKKELERAMAYARWCIRILNRKVAVCVLLLIMAGGCQLVGGGLRDIQWSADKLAEMAERAAETDE